MAYRLSKRRRDEPDSGQDSFLDIVANLVGILVILVMVIGVRAQDAWVQSSDDRQTATQAKAKPRVDTKNVSPPLRQELVQLSSTAADLAQGVRDLERQSDEVDAFKNERRELRRRLQVMLASARTELDAQQSVLGESEQAELQLQSEIDLLSRQLSRLGEQQQLLQQTENKPLELKHYPTPLAKTVFGVEEHYQLKNQRLAYVPLNQLTDMLRREAPRRIQQLRQVPQVTETLGPIRGFHMQYTLHRRTVRRMSKAGPVVRQLAELKEFVVIPESTQIGEHLSRAFSRGSQFRQQLEAYPKDVVLTVWTYPDSYAAYRQLREWLYERGYASAARPLPDGYPITASPQGSRSAMQ